MKLFAVLIALSFNPVRGPIAQFGILKFSCGHVKKLFEVLWAHSYEYGRLNVFGHFGDRHGVVPVYDLFYCQQD